MLVHVHTRIHAHTMCTQSNLAGWKRRLEICALFLSLGFVSARVHVRVPRRNVYKNAQLHVHRIRRSYTHVTRACVHASTTYLHTCPKKKKNHQATDARFLCVHAYTQQSMRTTLHTYPVQRHDQAPARSTRAFCTAPTLRDTPAPLRATATPTGARCPCRPSPRRSSQADAPVANCIHRS